MEHVRVMMSARNTFWMYVALAAAILAACSVALVALLATGAKRNDT